MSADELTFDEAEAAGARLTVLAGGKPTMCATHPAFESDYCPGCGTAAKIPQVGWHEEREIAALAAERADEPTYTLEEVAEEYR